MYNGIINVYKEKGYTSFDVVARMRGICGQKKIGLTEREFSPRQRNGRSVPLRWGLTWHCGQMG